MFNTCAATRNRHPIVLGFGANIPSRWGLPEATFRVAINRLLAHGVESLQESDIYGSKPYGFGTTTRFYNMIVVVDSVLPPAALLRLTKRLERLAGRRPGRRWGDRPLDIDILDYRGAQIATGSNRTTFGRLQLPHPELANRGFVLLPLAHAAPFWSHPHLQLRAKAILAKRPWIARDVVRVGSRRHIGACES